MKTIQKIGLGIGAGALALGGVAGFAGLAQAADPTPSATSSPAGTDQQASGNTERGPRGDRGGRHGDLAAKLAEKLGVEEAKVTEALQKAREAIRESRESAESDTSRPNRDERHAALAAELAKALGVEEAKVTEALNAISAERDAERAADLQTRLDQAVTDGTLTQAEAEAVKKAVEAGVIGGGGGRR